MEAIKSAIRAAVTAAHGECTLQLSASDLCISVCLHRHPDYVMYIRPDDRQTHFLCHYAHREDLAGCADVSAEMEAWKQQAVFQLPRKVSVGGLGQFAKVAIDYVRDAAARMELRRELNGRGAYVKVKTFAEAKQEAISNPMPRRGALPLPPPVCRRHMAEHREAEKRKRARDRAEAQRMEREGRDAKMVWGAKPKVKKEEEKEAKTGAKKRLKK